VSSREWLEADGLGGFACGPVAGSRTRRYHGLLVAAQGADRYLLVNGLEVTVETAAGRFALASQRWASGVVDPDADRWLAHFEPEPWPRWTYHLADGTRLVQELFVRHGWPETFVAFRATAASGRVVLRVRPLLSGRDYHALHHENPAFSFEPAHDGPVLRFAPYPGVPPLVVAASGEYRHEPLWYRRFHYAEEAARGLDCVEDLASPGELVFDLARGPAALVLAGHTAGARPAAEWLAEARAEEQARRKALGDPLARAADAYLVTRQGGRTIIAGYPWFTDWGRDTFVAVRGLCLATGRHDDARAILLRWTEAVSQGMLPNRFPDGGGPPEYNSVDAALWFVIAAYELLATGAASAADRQRLVAAVEAILSGHLAGARHGIRATGDGLLAAGAPGVQLTWMDSKIGDWVVTPRVGKPVEIQALWLNALALGDRMGTPSAARWRALHARGRESFAGRFWNGRALHDVVDVDHQPGTVDATFRPNQILAVGGLPVPVLEGEWARAVVDAVEARLLTPLGLRSLAPGEPGYRARYEGGPRDRDSAYHQGTVWPWLLGPFVEAWLRVRGSTPQARAEARRRFLRPLEAHLDEAGIGHVSEVADAEPPHRPGGCPFQAWSVGEMVRIAALVADEPAVGRRDPSPLHGEVAAAESG
jgi:predicted glycogen debranching enzyme